MAIREDRRGRAGCPIGLRTAQLAPGRAAPRRRFRWQAARLTRGASKAMADRTIAAPGDALALEARPLLPPPTRPGRVEDARSAADSVPAASWPLVPGNDPLYPVYTPKGPQRPVHAATHREFASELRVHWREAFRDRPHTLASDVNLYYEAAPPPGRTPGPQPTPGVPDFMLFLRTIDLSPYRSYRTWEVGARRPGCWKSCRTAPGRMTWATNGTCTPASA